MSKKQENVYWKNMCGDWLPRAYSENIRRELLKLVGATHVEVCVSGKGYGYGGETSTNGVSPVGKHTFKFAGSLVDFEVALHEYMSAGVDYHVDGTHFFAGVYRKEILGWYNPEVTVNGQAGYKLKSLPSIECGKAYWSRYNGVPSSGHKARGYPKKLTMAIAWDLVIRGNKLPDWAKYHHLLS